MSRQQRPVGSGHAHSARVVDRAAAPLLLGPANGEVDFFADGACTRPGIDPALFTSEEDDHQAVAAARAVCWGCPVRLPCRRYAYQANPYGVYGGETQAERVANLQAPARPAAPQPTLAREPRP
jgi:WhiB family transcriptional regulator, redox-sensing transcriptional regulator